MKPTKKWNFRHCFWIEREPTLADFEPLRGPYKFQHKREAPQNADAWLTDVDVQRVTDAADEPGQSTWCVTGIIETLGVLSDEEADDFSWQVLSEQAYQVIRDIIWGNTWYEGGVWAVDVKEVRDE